MGTEGQGREEEAGQGTGEGRKLGRCGEESDTSMEKKKKRGKEKRKRTTESLK